MKELIDGRYVFHPRYDHQTGMFTSPREIRPNKTVIIQGLHTLYLKKMRDNFDLKIFMAPEETLRMFWKTKRDISERGQSVEKIVESEEKRKPDALHHIDPQKKYADWIIEYYPLEKIKNQPDLKQQDVSLGVRHTIWNHAPVFELSHALKTLGACKVGVINQAEDINRLVLEVEGQPSSETIQKIAISLYPNLRQLTRSRRGPHWAEGLQGINQLVTLALLQGLEG
jgi:phosphoribulokinase